MSKYLNLNQKSMNFLDKFNNEMYRFSMGITQKDIARELGVSYITVNRVFNNSGYVSKKLRKCIIDYAKKKNYIPHRASQILVRNKVRIIGLFTSTWPPFFWKDIENGAMIAAEYLRSLNYLVKFFKVPVYNTENYCHLLKKELRNGLDAAAFVYQNFFDMDTIIGIVESAGIPFLMYNIDDPNKRGLGYIGTNNYEGGSLAANFIGQIIKFRSSLGVLVINSKSKLGNPPIIPEPNVQRLEGFLSVMKEQYPSVKCSVAYINEDNDDPSIKKQFRNILDQKKKDIEAIYLIPSCHSQFYDILPRNSCHNIILVQHDIDDEAVTLLNNKLISAVIFQDPVLQGYIVVRTLEKALESKTPVPRKEILISHSLILKENINSIQNHFFLGENNDI